jgi:hypothetical protein
MDEKSPQEQSSNRVKELFAQTWARRPSRKRFRPREWHRSNHLEVWLTVALIVGLPIVAISVLFGTELGRDLLELALDQTPAFILLTPAFILFSGLSGAIILVVFLAWTVVTGTLRSDPLEKFLTLLVLTALGMAIFAGSYSKSVWLGVGVYFVGCFIGGVVVMPVLPFFKYPRRTGYTYLGISIICLLAVAYFSADIGGKFVSPVLLVLLAILWILFVFALAAIGFLSERRASGIMWAFLGVFVWLLVKTLFIDPFSLVHLDRDYVRQGPPSDTPPMLQKLEAAYRAWREKQTEPVPKVVLVAAAGGGIRASYWTSLVLTRLADRGTDLRRKLFAASGVSGGSLGLGVSYGLLSAPAFTCAAASHLREPCVKLFHRQDFLVGPLGATLAGYPANFLVPFFKSRNYALEIGWERAWRDTVGQDSPLANAFSDPMTALWPKDKLNRPLLLLNATSARSGERVMSADVNIDWIDLQTSCRLNLAEEINLPLSAAIGASARFPFVSDWGWLWRPKSPGCGRLEGVADGGFFDNYGAATILDLLDGLASQKGGGVNLQRDVNLVVIQITSDPSREMGCLFKKLDAESRSHDGTGSTDDYCSLPPEQTAFQSSFLGSGEPSVIHVETQARAVNGIKIANRLRERTCALGGSYYHFAMTGAEAIPLNWALSPTSQTRLSELLDRGPGRDRLDRLVTELRTGVGLGQCAFARAQK